MKWEDPPRIVKPPNGERTTPVHRAPRVRLEVDDQGRPILHGGSGGGYIRGCRCEECTEANRLRCKAQYEHRVKLLARNHDVVEHGLDSTYTNWGCRCTPCTEAHSERMRSPEHREVQRRSQARRKARQAAQNVVVIPLEERL